MGSLLFLSGLVTAVTGDSEDQDYDQNDDQHGP